MADAKIITYGEAFSATTDVVPDNQTVALDIESLDGKEYVRLDTTDGTERLILGNGDGGSGVVPTIIGNYNSNRGAYPFIIDNGTQWIEMITGGTNKIKSQTATNFQLGTHGSHTLELITANTARVHIDSAGKVGIGGTPTSTLHVHGGNASIATFLRTGHSNAVLEVRGSSDDVILQATEHFAINTNAGTEALRIDASQKISTGGLSSGQLCAAGGIHIYESDTGVALSGAEGANHLVIESSESDGAGLTILSDDDKKNKIHFSDGAASGRIEYNHDGNIMSFYAFNHERLTIKSGGTVGIGQTTPAGFLEVECPDNANIPALLIDQDDTTNNPYAIEIQNAGTGDSIRDDSGAKLTAAGVFTDASDIALKSDIETLPYGLETVLQLKPVSYDYKKTGQADIGFIAQEVEQIIPEVVFGENGSKSMSYGHLVAVLTKALQEMHARIEELENGG